MHSHCRRKTPTCPEVTRSVLTKGMSFAQRLQHLFPAKPESIEDRYADCGITPSSKSRQTGSDQNLRALFGQDSATHLANTRKQHSILCVHISRHILNKTNRRLPAKLRLRNLHDMETLKSAFTLPIKCGRVVPSDALDVKRNLEDPTMYEELSALLRTINSSSALVFLRAVRTNIGLLQSEFMQSFYCTLHSPETEHPSHVFLSALSSTGIICNKLIQLLYELSPNPRIPHNFRNGASLIEFHVPHPRKKPNPTPSEVLHEGRMR